MLDFTGRAGLRRTEIELDHRHPRTRQARDAFRDAVLRHFDGNRDRYDFIVSHSNEVVSHAVARECKLRRPRLPWVAYFGDLVSANPYVAHMAEYPLHDEDCETERRTIEEADVVICNNEYQRQLMFSGELAKYASKARVIPHCFDRKMYPPPAPRTSDRFTFMHLGTLYHVKRTARPLFAGVDRLLEVYPEYRGRFEVVFYGGGYPGEDLQAHHAMKHRETVRLEGSVPYRQSLALMQSADVLVNIDGIFDLEHDHLEFNPFFPGKLVDYMGTGRPITAITMARGPTADVLRESGNLTADLRVDRIAYVLKRYLDGKVTPTTAPWERYSVERVGAAMNEVFQQVLR